MLNTKFPRGVQSADVWDAADAVLMAGQRPTIERVRQKLGRGSPNTVAPMLEAWFAQLGQRLGSMSDGGAGNAAPTGTMTHPGQPQPPATVLDLAQTLWNAALEQAHQAAHQQWEAAQAELAQQRSQLTTDRAELERERQTLTQQHSTLEQMLALSRAQVTDLTRRLADADAWRQEKEQSVAVLTNRLEDLRQQHKQLQQRLDDTVTAQAQERQQLQDRATQNEHRLLNEVDLARQDAKAARQTLAISQKQWEEAARQADEQLKSTQARLQAAETQSAASQTQLALLQRRNAELETTRQDNRHTIQTLQHQLATALSTLKTQPPPSKRSIYMGRVRKG